MSADSNGQRSFCSKAVSFMYAQVSDWPMLEDLGPWREGGFENPGIYSRVPASYLRIEHYHKTSLCRGHRCVG
ncbi:unnamed protein product [Leptidea sinapis]|uniref:Uncharacterized protein n=1 Tax=Leptidea sinapis TaxID=189913 RepID=A0A5E4R3E1_9NEOP|nr:unnamed protein product [Leptidea sinapis]